MYILLVHTPFDWKRPITTLPHLIRKVTKNFNNHAALFYARGLQWIFESDINGVNRIQLDDWIKKQTITVLELPEANPKGEIIRTKADSMVGKFKYSFWDLLWFMPIYIATGKWYGRTIEEAENKPTCYEYLGRVLAMDDWYKMTPSEFRKQCDERGYKVIADRISVHALKNLNLEE